MRMTTKYKQLPRMIMTVPSNEKIVRVSVQGTSKIAFASQVL